VGMLGKLLDRFRQKGPSRPRSKAEAEKRRRLVIVLLIVLAVVSSVSVVGYGYYDTSIKPWHGRIVKVNGTVVEVREFVNMLRLGQSQESYYSSSTEWAQSVATGMEENELMRQGLQGEKFGVDVSEVTSNEAVEAKLRETFVLYGLISDNATEDEYQQAYDNARNSLKSTGVSIHDYEGLIIKPSLISEELKKQIGDSDYPATDNFEHAQVQALLVTGSDNATQLRARWEAGEAFDTLSTDNSVSSYQRDFAADNTTIEWVAKGIKSNAFDDYTFTENTTRDVISQPVLDTDSSENYWVIRVLAKESRPLSDTDRDTLVSAAFTKWLEDAKNSEDNVIVYYLDKKGGTAKLAWALDHVAVSTS
jgi:hypothetical protein